MAKSRTKFVRKILSKFGYDLQRLQRTQNDMDNPSWHLTEDTGFDGFEAIIPRAVNYFDIVFRSCTRVEIFGQERKRLLGQPKSEVMERCLNSLLKSVENAIQGGVDIPIRLIVMDDHSSDQAVLRIKDLLSRSTCKNLFIALEPTGNGPSVGEAYTWAKKNAKDVIYFVEDDYLHEPGAILEIIRSYERHAAVLERDIVLFPADNPDRYRHVGNANIFLGSNRHWRTVGGTTFTSVTSIGILRKFWDNYIGLAQYGIDPNITEENTIQEIYKTVPCLCPMPGIAMHFQQIDEIPPFTNWKKLWAESKVDCDPNVQ